MSIYWENVYYVAKRKLETYAPIFLYVLISKLPDWNMLTNITINNQTKTNLNRFKERIFNRVIPFD